MGKKKTNKGAKKPEEDDFAFLDAEIKANEANTIKEQKQKEEEEKKAVKVIGGKANQIDPKTVKPSVPQSNENLSLLGPWPAHPLQTEPPSIPIKDLY